MVEFNKKLNEINQEIEFLKDHFLSCIDARQIEPIQFTMIIDLMSDAKSKILDTKFVLDY